MTCLTCKCERFLVESFLLRVTNVSGHNAVEGQAVVWLLEPFAVFFSLDRNLAAHCIFYVAHVRVELIWCQAGHVDWRVGAVSSCKSCVCRSCTQATARESSKQSRVHLGYAGAFISLGRERNEARSCQRDLFRNPTSRVRSSDRPDASRHNPDRTRSHSSTTHCLIL